MRTVERLVGKIIGVFGRSSDLHSESSAGNEPPGTRTDNSALTDKLPIDEQKVVRKRIQLKRDVAQDSVRIRRIVLMVGPALDNNPRRILQFINLFRLRTFIACDTALFDEIEDSPQNNTLTLEQLGKFVAIDLRWPLLLADLEWYPNLLTELQEIALNSDQLAEILKDRLDGPRERTLNRWAEQQDLLKLLRAGCLDGHGNVDQDEERVYTLANINVESLLQVSPRTQPRPATQPPPDIGDFGDVTPESESINLTTERVPEWVEARAWGRMNSRYIETSMVLPSAYMGSLRDYLESHWRYLERTGRRDSVRIIFAEPSELLRDRKEMPEYYLEFLQWHNENEVELLLLPRERAEVLAEEHGTAGVTDMACWEGELIVLWRYKGTASVQLQMAFVGDGLYERCRSFLDAVVAEATPFPGADRQVPLGDL